MDSGCSSRRLKKEFASDHSRLPTLPSSVTTFMIEDGIPDDVSENESDFFPDWSSVDSCSSSICSITGRAPRKFDALIEEDIYLNDEDFLRLPDNDTDIMTDDELQCGYKEYAFRG